MHLDMMTQVEEAKRERDKLQRVVDTYSPEKKARMASVLQLALVFGLAALSTLLSLALCSPYALKVALCGIGMGSVTAISAILLRYPRKKRYYER